MLIDALYLLIHSTGMFDFLKINDPFLCNGTFGQLAGLGPEHCVVMHKHLSELENGGWREKREFNQYSDTYYSSSTKKAKLYLDKSVVPTHQP